MIAGALKASGHTGVAQGFESLYLLHGWRHIARCIIPNVGRRQLKACGTSAAYNRHLSRGEAPCYDCRAAVNERDRDRYHRRHPNANRRGDLKPCGTTAAYTRHIRKGEKPCEACALAKRQAYEPKLRQLKPCGTSAAYARHKRRGEHCPVCIAAIREINRARSKAKAQKRQALSSGKQSTARCGTPAGYYKHRRNKTDICEPCRIAYRTHKRIKAGLPPEGKPRPACGTMAGYRRHRYIGEDACVDCKRAARNHTRIKQTGSDADPDPPLPCGTVAAWYRHNRSGETPCDPCKSAHREYMRLRSKPRRYWWYLYQQQSGWCALCSFPLPLNSSGIHVDHIDPVSRGGGNEIENLQAVHKLCNLIKGNRPNDEALALIDGRSV